MVRKLLGNTIRAILRSNLLKKKPTDSKIEDQISEVLSRAKNLKAYENSLIDYKNQKINFDVMNFFKELPVISKKDLKANPEHFKFDGINYFEVRTGGSTGEPLVFFQDRYSRKAQKRNMYFGRKKWGLNFNEDRCLLLWGHSGSFAPGFKGTFQKFILEIKDFFLDRRRISVYDLSPEKAKKIVQSINKNNPHYIQGYASSIDTLASLISSEGLELEIDNLKLIVSTAEPLLESQKLNIEKTFQCKVANEYGCTEIGVIAYSTPSGKIETVQENIYLEIIDIFLDNSIEYGEIVVTTLGDSSPILLRYKTGDLAKLTSQAKDISFINAIVGRNHDLIKLEDGSQIHGEFFTHVLENFDSIDRFQVHQTGLTEIKIILKTNLKWSDSQSPLLIDQLNKVLNNRAKIDIILDDFEFESSGKFRWIKSDF